MTESQAMCRGEDGAGADVAINEKLSNLRNENPIVKNLQPLSQNGITATASDSIVAAIQRSFQLSLLKNKKKNQEDQTVLSLTSKISYPAVFQMLYKLFQSV